MADQLKFEFAAPRRATVSVTVAARLANVSQECMRKWADTGRVRAYKLFGRWRVDRAALIEKLDEAERSMNSVLDFGGE